MRKEAIGLSIEGTDIKVAHVAFSHKGVILKRLEVAQLPEPLGIAAEEEEPESESLDAFEEAFGEVGRAKTGPGQEAEDEEQLEEEDASTTLLGVLSGYNLTKAKIGVNLPEDAVSFYTLSDTFAIKGRKLKKALIDMVSPKHDGPISLEMVDYVKAADKNLACLICDREPAFLEVLKELKPFLGMNKPFVGLIDSMDTALMGLVRADHELVEGEITAIIYIGSDSTRIIIMKGREYLRFLPSIQEGANSPELINTVFSKILFEQDEGGLPEINHVVLAGEADMPSALEFFSKRMPDARVEIIRYGKFAGSEMEPSKIPAPLSSFALPLALAKKALDPTNPDYYQTDFTPDYLKESQKPFRIAWHGVLSLLVIFAMSLLLVVKGGYNYVEMAELEKDTFNYSRLTQLAQPLLYEIDMLNEQISLYESEITQLASLAQNSNIWSESLQKLCDLTERCDSLWITSMNSAEDKGYVLGGKSRTREKITALASAYQNSYLDVVNRGMIRDYRLWDFTMRVKFPDALQPQIYLARVKKHGKDGFGQGAHVGADEAAGLVAGAQHLGFSTQQFPAMSGGEFPAMPTSFGMDGSVMVDSLLRAGFNAYYEQAKGIAGSPELTRLQTEQEMREAELWRLWMQQKQVEEEQKLAATEKSIDEQYLGPEEKASQSSPTQGPEPAPETEPAPEAEPIPEAKPEPAPKAEPAPEAKPEAPAKAKSAGEENKETPQKDEQADQSSPPVKAAEQSTTTREEEPKVQKQEVAGPKLQTASGSTSSAMDGDYDRALELFKAGEYDQSAGLFNEMLAARTDPKNDCNAHYWLGHCLFGMGDFKAAIVELETAGDCEDKSIQDGVLFMLGNCHLRLGNERSANEKYARLLRDHPTSRFGPIASARTKALSQP